MELDALTTDNLIEPDDEVRINDHVVGCADGDVDIKKLYTIAIRLIREAEQAALDARWAKGKTAKEEALKRATELGNKAKIVMGIFWASVHDSFDLWGKPSIGIRENWQVVWTDEDTSLPPFLKGLLGEDLS